MLFGYLLANRKWKTLSQPLDSGRFPNVCKQTQNMGSSEYRVPLDPLVNYHFAYEYCNSGASYHMFRHTHLFYLLSSGYLSQRTGKFPFYSQVHHYKSYYIYNFYGTCSIGTVCQTTRWYRSLYPMIFPSYPCKSIQFLIKSTMNIDHLPSGKTRMTMETTMILIGT